MLRSRCWRNNRLAHGIHQPLPLGFGTQPEALPVAADASVREVTGRVLMEMQERLGPTVEDPPPAFMEVSQDSEAL